MAYEEHMLAYCGIYCEQCSFRCAFLTGSAAHLDPFPGHLMKSPPGDPALYDCECCKGRSICGPCKIRDCASARRLASCADCPEFPCARTDAFARDGFPHHADAVQNLMRIREVGADVWYDELAPSLTGPDGERLSWYYRLPSA